KEIFGKWQFIYNTGGFFGGGGSNRFPENCWVKFSRTGNFNVFEGSKLISTTRFMLTMKKNYNDEYIPAIITNIELGRYETYRIEGDRLYLREQGSDSFT